MFNKKRGGYWEKDKDSGKNYYHGVNENPLYLKEINELKELSTLYIIPKNIKSLLINVQKD